MSEFIDVGALWRVLVFGLLGGAGVVAAYALGLVGLASPGLGGRMLAALCLLVVAAGVVLGLYAMLAK